MSKDKIRLIHDAKKKREEEDKVDVFKYIEEMKELIEDEEQQVMVCMIKTDGGFYNAICVPHDHMLEAVGMLDMFKHMIIEQMGEE